MASAPVSMPRLSRGQWAVEDGEPVAAVLLAQEAAAIAWQDRRDRLIARLVAKGLRGRSESA